MTFETGRRIFAENDPSDLAYMILSGRVAISVAGRDGQKVVSTLGAGEVFGEMGVIDSSPRSATATAVEDCVCVAMEAEELLRTLEADPKEAVAYIKSLIHRLRRATDQIAQA